MPERERNLGKPRQIDLLDRKIKDALKQREQSAEHRKSASSLSMGTSISCKMAFSALTGPKTLILRPEIDIGSGFQPPALGCRPAFAENDPLDHFPGASAPGDVHVAACGLQSKRLRPLRCIPGVCRQSEEGHPPGAVSRRRLWRKQAGGGPMRQGARRTALALSFARRCRIVVRCGAAPRRFLVPHINVSS